jgi:hypothetical protein
MCNAGVFLPLTTFYDTTLTRYAEARMKALNSTHVKSARTYSRIVKNAMCDGIEG